jgi:hypothetical protein
MARSYTPTLSRARSSVGERSLHTREVGGSKPPAPISRKPRSGGVSHRRVWRPGRRARPVEAHMEASDPGSAGRSSYRTPRRWAARRSRCVGAIACRSWTASPTARALTPSRSEISPREIPACCITATFIASWTRSSACARRPRYNSRSGRSVGIAAPMMDVVTVTVACGRPGNTGRPLAARTLPRPSELGQRPCPTHQRSVALGVTAVVLGALPGGPVLSWPDRHLTTTRPFRQPTIPR